MSESKIRTTVYLDKELKKMADIQAVRDDTTLQEIFNKALRVELQKRVPSKKKRIEFVTAKIDLPHDLHRVDYYDNN